MLTDLTSSLASSTPVSAAASPSRRSTASLAKTLRSGATSTSCAARSSSRRCSRRWNPSGSSRRGRSAPTGETPGKIGGRAAGACSRARDAQGSGLLAYDVDGVQGCCWARYHDGQDGKRLGIPCRRGGEVREGWWRHRSLFISAQAAMHRHALYVGAKSKQKT